MTTKICSDCKLEFPATTEYYYTQKNGKYGLRGMCKGCYKKYHIVRKKEWAINNPEKAKQYREAYYQSHKDYFKQYYQANKDKYKAYRKQYYNKHRDQLIASQKERYHTQKGDTTNENTVT